MLPTVTTAQFKKGGARVLSAEFMQGAIFEHKKQISHLITNHPWGIRISLDQGTNGSETWQSRYNYPDIGLSFIYMNYKNETLGQTYALAPHYKFYITKNKKSLSQFGYKIAFGLAYNTQKYDRETNNKNNVLSTDLSFAVLFEGWYQYKVNNKLGIKTSVSMTHFSNAAWKKPNSGINIFSLNFGLSYYLNSSPVEYVINEEEALKEKSIGYTLTISGGAHEAVRINTGTYPFFVTSAFIDKRLNRKSRLGLGLEWFYSISLKKFREDDYWLAEGDDPDFNRVGIALSHELTVNEFSVLTQAGYYLYDPYSVFDPIYLRLMLRRYFGAKIYGSVAVKSHAAKAEAAEFGIGYRLK